MDSSGTSSSDDEPKRRKRSRMFYRHYANHNGAPLIPRSTLLDHQKRVKSQLQSNKSADTSKDLSRANVDLQIQESGSKRQTTEPSSQTQSTSDHEDLSDNDPSQERASYFGQQDASQPEDSETDFILEDLGDSDSFHQLSDNAASFFGHNGDSEPSLSSQSNDSTDTEAHDFYTAGGSGHSMAETLASPNSSEKSGSDSESVSNSSSSETSQSLQDDFQKPSENSDEEDDPPGTRFRIKLGDFAGLGKKYKLDDPLLSKVVETSRFETLLMVLSFAMQVGLSYVGIGLLLKLINQVFGQIVIPESVKIFRSLFDCDLGLSYHFYCLKCKCYLGSYSSISEKGNNFVCPVRKCEKRGSLSNMNDGNFYLYIPLESQFRVFLETKKGVKDLLAYRFWRKKSENTITDVFDGELYQKFVGPDGILSNQYNFSVTLNTDGSPIFKSVKNTLWPIQCRINELPPGERFHSDNMFVCGLWFGKEEPDMNLFLSQYVKESSSLYDKGFEWNLNGKAIRSRVVTLNSCLDSRAKPDVQCHKQLHSYDGCSYCYHPGNLVNLSKNQIVLQEDSDSVEDSDSDSPQEEREEDGVTQVARRTEAARVTQGTAEKKKREVKAVRYCGGYLYPERTDQEIREDMRESEDDGRVHRGIKGMSVLIRVPEFDLALGFVIDYMHAILLGVVKTCLNLWLSSKFSKEDYSVSSRLKDINKRLLSLRPPNNISRRPRSLADYIYYKANELRAWLYFYSLPCLKGILPDMYFRHFSLLVTAMAILCSDCISLEELGIAEVYLQLFVADFERLYGPAFMVHNIHITCHLPRIVRANGPCWSHSAFTFESGNGVLTNLVCGTVGVMSQIANKYMTYRCTPLLQNSFNISNKVLAYCESLVPKRRCKDASYCSGITLLGSAGVEKITEQQKRVLEESGLPLDVSCFYRFILNGTVYHSVKYPKQGKKSYDSAICTNDGKFGIIERVFICSNKVYVILREIIVETNSYIAKHDTCGAKCTHIRVCALYPFGSLKVVRANVIESKCVLLKVDQCTYVCHFPNNFEKD